MLLVLHFCEVFHFSVEAVQNKIQAFLCQMKHLLIKTVADERTYKLK